jgi:hypothetical protein
VTQSFIAPANGMLLSKINDMDYFLFSHFNTISGSEYERRTGYHRGDCLKRPAIYGLPQLVLQRQDKSMGINLEHSPVFYGDQGLHERTPKQDERECKQARYPHGGHTQKNRNAGLQTKTRLVRYHALERLLGFPGAPCIERLKYFMGALSECLAVGAAFHFRIYRGFIRIIYSRNIADFPIPNPAVNAL